MSITLKYIPNILATEGRCEKQLTHAEHLNVDDYIRETGIVADGMRVIVNGHIIKDLTRGVHDKDEVIVTPDVRFDPATYAAIYYAFQGWMIVAAIAATAYSIYQAVSYKKPASPSYGTNAHSAASMDSSSPTYGWDGIATTQEVGIPVPILYGEHVAGGNRIIKL